MGRCSAATEPAGETKPQDLTGCGGPGARWAPFRTGLRCHFGRCWASATGRQHRDRPATAFPYPKKGGRVSPSWGATEPGVLLVEGAGWVPQSLSGLPPVGRMRPARCFFFPAAPVKVVGARSTPRKLLKKFDQNFYAPSALHLRPCGTQEGGLSRAVTRLFAHTELLKHSIHDLLADLLPVRAERAWRAPSTQTVTASKVSPRARACSPAGCPGRPGHPPSGAG